MKKFILSLTVLFVSSFAQANEPLIVKSSGGGFMPVEYVRSERCKLFHNKVVIEKSFGGVLLTQEKNISLSQDIDDIIEKAKQEKIAELPNMLCDGPSTHITTTGGELLYTTGGCGAPEKNRQGPYSQILKDIAGQFCEKTFQFN